MRHHPSLRWVNHRPFERFLLVAGLGLSLAVFNLACTTPTTHSRQVFRRGQTADHPSAPWWPAAGLRLEAPFAADPELGARLAATLTERLIPALGRSDNPPRRSRRIGKPRLACPPHGKGFRCYAQVFVEVLGRRGRTALWAREGVALLEVSERPEGARLRRLADALLGAAIDAALSPEHERSARARGALGQSLARGDIAALPGWFEELSQADAVKDRRIALWLAFGHLADARWLPRLAPLSTHSPNEAEAKAWALAWIDAAGAAGEPSADPTSNVPSRPRGVH
jgi:hypothetical protein